MRRRHKAHNALRPPQALQLFGVAKEVPADPWDTGGRDASDEDVGGGGAAVAAAGGDGDKSNAIGKQQPKQGHASAAAAAARQGGSSRLDLAIAGAIGNQGDQDGAADAADETALLYAPFHAYTMRNAVHDGFVLDVLRSYTAVTPRLQIAGLRGGGGGGPAGCPSGVPPDPIQGNEPGLDPGGGHEIAEEVLVEAASNSRDVVERKVRQESDLQLVVVRWLAGG